MIQSCHLFEVHFYVGLIENHSFWFEPVLLILPKSIAAVSLKKTHDI